MSNQRVESKLHLNLVAKFILGKIYNYQYKPG